MPKTAPKDIKNDILLIDAGDTSKNNPAITISGLFHLLSMSGSHVAIVTAIFLSVLFFLPLKIRFTI